MKRYPIPILILLVLVLGLVVGCAEETTTYYNRQFGYSVQMPKSWVVVEYPEDNTVGFGSEESYTSDKVFVTVTPGKIPYSAVTEQHLGTNTEYKVYEYGKGDYIEYFRIIGVSNWSVIYFMGHNGFLYEIKFREEGTQKKVHVSIDGYGKVN